MLISTTFEIIQNVSPPRGLIAGIKFHLKFDLPEVPEIITVQIFDILSLRGAENFFGGIQRQDLSIFEHLRQLFGIILRTKGDIKNLNRNFFCCHSEYIICENELADCILLGGDRFLIFFIFSPLLPWELNFKNFFQNSIILSRAPVILYILNFHQNYQQRNARPSNTAFFKVRDGKIPP